MFTWQISLSARQLALLRAFDEWDDSGGQGIDTTQDEQDSFSAALATNSNFVPTVQGLLRHGLVFHHQPPKAKRRQRHESDQHHNYWGITKKGRLLLRVIDCDVHALKEEKRPKRLKRAE